MQWTRVSLHVFYLLLDLEKIVTTVGCYVIIIAVSDRWRNTEKSKEVLDSVCQLILQQNMVQQNDRRCDCTF